MKMAEIHLISRNFSHGLPLYFAVKWQSIKVKKLRGDEKVAKKLNESYFTTSLNIDALKQLKPNAMTQEIARLANKYKKLLLTKRSRDNPFLPKLVQLTSKMRENAIFPSWLIDRVE